MDERAEVVATDPEAKVLVWDEDGLVKLAIRIGNSAVTTGFTPQQARELAETIAGTADALVVARDWPPIAR